MIGGGLVSEKENRIQLLVEMSAAYGTITAPFTEDGDIVCIDVKVTNDEERSAIEDYINDLRSAEEKVRKFSKPFEDLRKRIIKDLKKAQSDARDAISSYLGTRDMSPVAREFERRIGEAIDAFHKSGNPEMATDLAKLSQQFAPPDNRQTNVRKFRSYEILDLEKLLPQFVDKKPNHAQIMKVIREHGASAEAIVGEGSIRFVEKTRPIIRRKK